MPIIYFTSAAIGYLTELILASAITLYLATRLRRTQFPTQTGLLVGSFAATTLLILLLFCDVALPPSQRLYAVFVENIAVGLCLIFLLQFAYHFPHFDARKKWEARIILVLSILYMLWETQFALFRFTELSAGHVFYRTAAADYALAVGFLWAPLVFIRQTIFADERPILWFWKVWQPQGRPARGARDFALVYLLTFILALANLLRGLSFIPTALYQLSLSVGLAFALFAFATVYLNALPERTSFIVKLVGATLTTLLTILSSVGWMLTPVYSANYLSPISDHQTLRFTPNADGGYDVTRVPFYFDQDLGSAADLPTTGDVDTVAEDFTFPFFGKLSQTIYISDIGSVSIGQPFENTDVQYYYGTSPAIFLLNTHLLPEAGGGVWVKDQDERLTVTWSNVPFFFDRQSSVTLQLVLERNGSFEITYASLPEKLIFDPDQGPFENAWLIGATPGDFTHPPSQVNFVNLPLAAKSTGLVQDYYLDFRQYLNRLLAPLAYLILLSSLFILVGVPTLLYASIVAPLNRLIGGMQQVDAGNRAITLPIQAQDEIGFLTESFNGMIAQLSALVTGLEARVAERTAELQRLAITDPLTEIFNRRHLLILGKQAFEQAQRYHHPLAAMMIDIDHFKQVNDTHGHAAGDLLLIKLTEYLQKNLRSADTLARYGGEEFVVLMPQSDLDTAQRLAERLLVGIRALHINNDSGEISFTTSIGVVALDHANDASIDALIARSDQAMYAAKQAGRDCVIAHT